MKKEVWFGLTIMALVVLSAFILLPSPSEMTNGHLGLLMLALVVVAIMLGFPTAFTLMGMGMIFAWIAYKSQNPDLAVSQTLDLMVQRAYSVMSNDVLISIPLFVFMGYLIERANLIEKLFKSMHLAMARLPGSLAVATIVTCAIFATATGIVGAVVTLMGLLALPAMLRAGLQRAVVSRCHHGRWLFGHFDSAFGHVDRVRCDGWCVGGQAVCRCIFPRHHAGHFVCCLCGDHCQDQTPHGTAHVG
jgi:hypothetical protein